MSNFSITLFIAFTSLHRPFCFTLTFLSEFVVKYPKTSSFYWILLCTNSSFTKATHSFPSLKSITHYHKYHHITLSLNHSIMYATVGTKKLANQKRKLLLSMKTLLLILIKSPYARNFLFLRLPYVFFFFFSFSLFSLLRPLS